MFETLRLLFRAEAARAENTLFDRTATIQLEQRIREAAAAHERGKRELAAAMAHQSQEARSLESLVKRIADLEERARAALAGGREDLAQEAARAIATFENERIARERALADLDLRLERLRLAVEGNEQRLGTLQRGLKAARAAEALRRLSRGSLDPAGRSALAEAEATLRRIEDRDQEEAAVEAAQADLERSLRGTDITERLAEAGFGTPARVTPEAVLARLKGGA